MRSGWAWAWRHWFPAERSLPESFVADRRCELAARLRVAGLGVLVPVVGGFLAPLSPSASSPTRTLGFVGHVAVALLVAVLAGLRGAERHARALGVAFIVGMGALLPASVSLEPEHAELLAGTLAMLLAAAALILPWGARAQIGVATTLVGGICMLLPWRLLAMDQATSALLVLLSGAMLSVVGAAVLDQHRLATHLERETARALARQRALLLEVSRELNGLHEAPALAERIVALGRDLVGGDVVALTLRTASPGRVRVAAVAAEATQCRTGFPGLEFATSPELARTLERRSSIEVPAELRLERLDPVLAMAGASSALLVCVARPGEVLGSLSFLNLGAGQPFTAEQRQLAEGIAHQAAVALANVRLVEALRRANAIKTEFVATMSHELRTPLHVILGYTEMLEDAVGGDRDREVAVASIRRASRELLDLIEATLDLNRLESGRDEPELAWVSLAELLAELEAEFAAIERDRRVGLHFARLPEPLTLLTDRRKLRTILKNLIGNALKYTVAGEVSVDCRAVDGDVELSVSDTGVGISAADQERIFEMFRQVPATASASHGGVGLGLYIVRRLAEQIGARVSVWSEPGRGSRFAVELPREPRPAAGPA